MNTMKPRSRLAMIAWGLLLLTALSCTWSLNLPAGSARPTGQASGPTQVPAPASLPMAETSFDVYLPGPLPEVLRCLWRSWTR
jgi:hypothetical protein